MIEIGFFFLPTLTALLQVQLATSRMSFFLLIYLDTENREANRNWYEVELKSIKPQMNLGHIIILFFHV